MKVVKDRPCNARSIDDSYLDDKTTLHAWHLEVDVILENSCACRGYLASQKFKEFLFRCSPIDLAFMALVVEKVQRP